MSGFLAGLLHPGHAITVTTGAIRVHVECPCGLDRRFASKVAAVRAGLEHHHDVGGCNCPPQVRDSAVHPAVSSTATARAGGPNHNTTLKETSNAS